MKNGFAESLYELALRRPVLARGLPETRHAVGVLDLRSRAFTRLSLTPQYTLTHTVLCVEQFYVGVF